MVRRIFVFSVLCLIFEIFVVSLNLGQVGIVLAVGALSFLLNLFLPELKPRGYASAITSAILIASFSFEAGESGLVFGLPAWISLLISYSVVVWALIRLLSYKEK